MASQRGPDAPAARPRRHLPGGPRRVGPGSGRSLHAPREAHATPTSAPTPRVGGDEPRLMLSPYYQPGSSDRRASGSDLRPCSVGRTGLPARRYLARLSMREQGRLQALPCCPPEAEVVEERRLVATDLMLRVQQVGGELGRFAYRRFRLGSVLRARSPFLFNGLLVLGEAVGG